jgi:hypothetical protein
VLATRSQQEVSEQERALEQEALEVCRRANADEKISPREALQKLRSRFRTACAICLVGMRRHVESPCVQKVHALPQHGSHEWAHARNQLDLVGHLLADQSLQIAGRMIVAVASPIQKAHVAK